MNKFWVEKQIFGERAVAAFEVFAESVSLGISMHDCSPFIGFGVVSRVSKHVVEPLVRMDDLESERVCNEDANPRTLKKEFCEDGAIVDDVAIDAAEKLLLEEQREIGRRC